MSNTSTVVTLVAGGAAGAAITAVYNTIASWRRNVRESRFRFADQKRQVYARLAAVLGTASSTGAAYRQLVAHAPFVHGALQTTEHVEAHRRWMASLVDYQEVMMEINIIGGPEMPKAARDYAAAMFRGGGPDATSAYVNAARRDIGIKGEFIMPSGSALPMP